MGLILATGLFVGWLERTERHLYGVKPGVYLEDHLVEGYLRDEVEDVIDEMIVKYRRLPVDAGLDRETGTVIKEKNGWEVDAGATLERVMRAPEGTRVKVVRVPVPPKHYASELYQLNRELGSFYTWFYGSWQRHQNIVLALRSINNTVIWPGEVFSFNQVVGPRTPERGYRPAPVIGEDGIGFGGGVCQVSTTLYNSAILAGLEIVERHPHSTRVPYIEPGKDATVVFGAQDLKIKNNYDHPVIIKAGIYRGKIQVTIIGR